MHDPLYMLLYLDISPIFNCVFAYVFIYLYTSWVRILWVPFTSLCQGTMHILPNFSSRVQRWLHYLHPLVSCPWLSYIIWERWWISPPWLGYIMRQRNFANAIKAPNQLNLIKREIILDRPDLISGKPFKRGLRPSLRSKTIILALKSKLPWVLQV